MNKKYILFIMLAISFLVNEKNVQGSIIKSDFKESFIGTYHYVDSNGKFGDFEKFVRNNDNHIAYCIQPGIPLSSNTYDGYYNLPLEELASKVGLNEDQLRNLSLYAYYGYGYGNHNTNSWIVATQARIWQLTGRSFQFTSRNSINNPWQYVISTPQEILEIWKELDNLVSMHDAKPYLGSNIKVALGQSINLTDSSNQLSKYQISECKNCTASINDNILTITPTSSENGSVSLSKQNSAWDQNFIVYASNNGQNVMTAGNLDPVYSSIKYNVYSGSLKLKKYDADNKSCKSQAGGSLKGTKYKLYKSNGTYVTTLVIDDNCEAYVDNLEITSYYVEEFESGLNYEIDKTKYFFDLTGENNNIEKTVYNKIYSAKLKVIKIDSVTKKPIKKRGIKFKIFDLVKNEYVCQDADSPIKKKICFFETNEQGEFITPQNLYPSTYILEELDQNINGYLWNKENIKFVISKDMNIEQTTDLGIVLTIEFPNSPVTGRFIIKKFGETFIHNNNEFIFDKEPLNNITFGLYAHEEVIIEENVYHKDELIEYLITDQNGHAEIDLPLAKYYLKEMNTDSTHILNDNLYFFELKYIDQHTPLVEFFLELENKLQKGSIEITKTDISNGQGILNAEIEIYTTTDQLIYSGKTNDIGKLFVDNIPLGDYYFIEKNAPDGYIIDSDKHYFSILENNQFIKLELPNEKKLEVPNTYTNKINLAYFIGGIVILIGMGLCFYDKKKK